MSVTSVCGIILASADPKALAEFYSAALGISFEREEHGGLLEHFGVDIGEVHFGIHPPENLGKTSAGNSSVSIAFNVESLQQVISRLEELGAIEVIAPHDEGFGMVATYADLSARLIHHPVYCGAPRPRVCDVSLGRGSSP